MNLCERGHDKDVVGLVKRGKHRDGRQRYRCRECKKIDNAQSNKLATSVACKWFYTTRNMERYKEAQAQRRRQYPERVKQSARKHRARVKSQGGAVAYFWQQQARKSL